VGGERIMSESSHGCQSSKQQKKCRQKIKHIFKFKLGAYRPQAMTDTLIILVIDSRCVGVQGDTRNGQKHGYGVFKAANGASYTGWWVDGKKHGKGTYVSASGESHEGWWKDNQPDPKSALPSQSLSFFSLSILATLPLRKKDCVLH